MALSGLIGYPDFKGEHSTPQFQAGTIVEDRNQNQWIYVQAGATLSEGDTVQPVSEGIALSQQTIDTGTAINGTKLFTSADFTTTVLVGGTCLGVANGHRYRFLTDTSAAQNQGGVITNRVGDGEIDIYVEAGGTAFSPDGKLVTATVAASTTFVIWNLTRVTGVTAVTDKVLGIAQWAVTDEYWSFILHRGFGYTQLDTSDNAIDAGDKLIIPADNLTGGVQGTTGTTAEDELACAFGRTIIDTDADGMIPVFIWCDNIWPIGTQDEGRHGEKYPTWIGAGPV
jgi:hypothetical protein